MGWYITVPLALTGAMKDRIDADIPERANMAVGAVSRWKMLGYCHPWIGEVMPRLTCIAPAGESCLYGIWRRMVRDVSPGAAAMAVVREYTVATWSDGRGQSVWNWRPVRELAQSRVTTRSGSFNTRTPRVRVIPAPGMSRDSDLCRIEPAS